MKPTQNVIIDTDPGDDIDDLLAISFALLRPELDVKAITTVTTFPERRARLVRALLRSFGKAHIPVGSGIALPMRSLSEAELQKMTDNNGYVLNHAAAADIDLSEQPKSDVEPQDHEADEPEDAVELIIRTIEQLPGEIGLITLGPLSNAAAALHRKPSIASKLSWIAMMGGEVRGFRQEHNITWDDRAAEVVFQSGVPLFLGTWDITRRVVITEELCERIRKHDSGHCRFLTSCIDLWWPYKAHKPGPVMFDIAPVIWSFRRDLYDTLPMAVRVETRGQYTRGVTVPVPDGEPNVDITVGIHDQEVLELLMDTLCP
ncbi:nucleoside hydrolase [Paenibacillus piri]|uniref:Nucleoside hydrolase n=1 Tax=Paenibacillus piri TaxID=2547395 RepID=A0A4R5KUS9_9BACL|nr:nucleoside hydrolase [Paenibacillus piri]TDF99693.1 nucleoside hydrolase [Paenibacillus piri]